MLWKKEGKDKRSRWKVEKRGKAMGNGLYLLGDGITKTNDYLSRAVDASAQRSLASMSASRLVVNFKGSTIQNCFRLAWKVPARFGQNIPDADVSPTFFKSRYMTDGYILTMECNGIELTSIRTQVKYGIKAHKEIVINSFDFIMEKNSFLVVLQWSR